MTDYKISKLSPIHQSNMIGIYSTTGGDVSYGALTSDFTMPVSFALLHIGAGGDIVFEDYEGNVFARYAILDGSVIAVCIKKILVSGVVNGISRTTTCQKITWESATNLIEA